MIPHVSLMLNMSCAYVVFQFDTGAHKNNHTLSYEVYVNISYLMLSYYYQLYLTYVIITNTIYITYVLRGYGDRTYDIIGFPCENIR